MNQEKKQKINIVLIKNLVASFLVILSMTFIMGGVTYALNRPAAEIIRNTITFVWGCFVMVFLWYQGKISDTLDYDNKNHPFRFLFVFVICFLISIGMIFAPALSWVFLSIMVVLSMFSNTMTGLTGGSMLLLLTTCLSEGGSMYIFFLYFMIGLLGIAFFGNLGLDFQVTGPMILSGIISFILQTAYLVIFENQTFSRNLFYMPLLNLFINMVLLFLILKYFSRLSMYILQDKYADINDQEFPVMAELKNKDRKAYFEAIHTAYLGERIARKLNMNYKAVKGCCYYYKIAGSTRETKEGNRISLMDYYEFPEELQELIKECQQGIYGSKEACVVLTSNKVIENIVIAQENSQQGKIPYEKIIESIFEKFIHTDILYNCDISMYELQVMKRTYIEENLYYDFLR